MVAPDGAVAVADDGGHLRMPEEIGLEFVCAITQAIFKNRKLVRDSTNENCIKSGKRWLRRTLESAAVRQAIGAAPQQWVDIHSVFYLALPILEAQSLPLEGSQLSITTASLIAQNHDNLMKDLERLNDILLIARNCLATTQKAQNLAGESFMDQQVLKLIDLCIRVTARGYDGEAPSRAEQSWANVIGSYKKLLITCLQFLHNFIMKNEQRKLLLWLDLFANSKIANEFTIPPELEKEPSEHEPATEVVKKEPDAVGNGDKAEAKSQNDTERSRTQSDKSSGSAKSKAKKDMQSASKENAALIESSQQDTNSNASAKNDGNANLDDGLQALRSPESAAVTLQAAKDQLMARLADVSPKVDDADNAKLPQESAPAEYSDEEEYPEHEPGDQQRGLLTDIPLVLGPQEIEALPMIIQIGICPGLGSILHGRDMQGMRCNILLAGEAGRNLLRELLIFIAAWDLQDDEVYFKLMMQIMEAVLDNGLMPYAYQTFSEVKDIISPAQTMIIKILTQIFRAKQSASSKPMTPTNASSATKDKIDATSSASRMDSTRRVDVYIVRYIFTIFRSSIIPETCALIYLQGQIKAGAALPEDFPLNLWDMERVYEGVYQFLEFFAVLTESEQWKKLLVQWEIVSELVTLLRELELSIPKGPITAATIPQTVAEAQAEAKMQARDGADSAEKAPEQDPKQAQDAKQKPPTPIAIERPFDMGAPEMPGEAYPGSSTNNADNMSDHGSDDSADPSDFEWRNLKKLVILVLSSLVWKAPAVQEQIRRYGGVEMVLACCNYDSNNPYIREHAVMCLRFLLEGSGENKAIVEKLQEVGKMPPEELARAGFQVDGVNTAKPLDDPDTTISGPRVTQVEETSS